MNKLIPARQVTDTVEQKPTELHKYTKSVRYTGKVMIEYPSISVLIIAAPYLDFNSEIFDLESMD